MARKAREKDASKTWYFTFGCGQLHAGRVQPIVAESYDEARAKMFQMYGGAWCFQYSNEDWADIKKRRDIWSVPVETELPTVYCVRVEEGLCDV